MEVKDLESYLKFMGVDFIPKEMVEAATELEASAAVAIQNTSEARSEISTLQAKSTRVEQSEAALVETRVLPPLDLSAVENLEDLRTIASSCTRCGLCSGRQSVVFSDGNEASPDIAFVGEGPGADEDIQGLPFVGAAGQLLTRAIEQGLKVSRDTIYICNVVKCRPPGNRTPTKDEVQACMPYLEKQLELVKPKVIVALGKVAASALSGSEVQITKVRGNWGQWQGIPVMPTFHPAYLLRNEEAKRPFWEDLKSVMAKLGEMKAGGGGQT